MSASMLSPVHHLHESLPALSASPDGCRVWAEISTDALVHNYTVLSGRVKAVSPSTRALAVVKADAYGHGVAVCASALTAVGCRAFAVACLEEAVALRQALLSPALPQPVDPATGLRPAQSLILILGYTDPAYAHLLARYDVSAALVSADHAAAMSEAAVSAGVTVKVHAALDTGMNRIGFCAHNEDEIAAAVAGIRAVSALPGLFIEGMFTHFAMSDEDYAGQMTADPSSRTWTQLSRYRAVLAGLEAAGCRPPVCHVCNSAAAVRFPGLSDFAPACLDMVRLGINLYGYGVPAPEEGFPALKPVMTLKTRVTHLHTLQPGEQVGYGGTYSAGTPRTIATLPIGYADGFIRALKGCSVVIHTAEGDVTAPLAGRICMDQCMADVTGLPVSVGDTVTLFGDDPAQLEALAARAGTITYELLCLLTARVPRFTV